MLKKKLLIPIMMSLVVLTIVMVLGKWNLLVWVLFLLCPLMHLFGHNHSGHGVSGHHHSESSKHMH